MALLAALTGERKNALWIPLGHRSCKWHCLQHSRVRERTRCGRGCSFSFFSWVTKITITKIYEVHKKKRAPFFPAQWKRCICEDTIIIRCFCAGDGNFILRDDTFCCQNGCDNADYYSIANGVATSYIH